MLCGVQIICACCGAFFGVCRPCYRGQVYCSNECRISGTRERRREAWRRYRQKEKGWKQHCEAEARRRKRIKQSEQKYPNMIVKSCMCLAMRIKMLFKNIDPLRKKGKCSVCGCYFGDIAEFIDISLYGLTWHHWSDSDIRFNRQQNQNSKKMELFFFFWEENWNWRNIKEIKSSIIWDFTTG